MNKSFFIVVSFAVLLSISSTQIFADMGSCVYSQCSSPYPCEFNEARRRCFVQDACSPVDNLPELKISAGAKIYEKGNCFAGSFRPLTAEISNFIDFEIVPGVVVPSTSTVFLYLSDKKHIYLNKFKDGQVVPCHNVHGTVFSWAHDSFEFLYGQDAKWHPSMFRLTNDLVVNDPHFGQLILARSNALLTLAEDGMISEVIYNGPTIPLANGSLRCF